MAIESTATFDMTRDEIINAALRKVTSDRGPFDPDEIDNASQALNLIVKGLQSRNIFLWATQITTQALQSSSEVLGSDGLNYTCRKSHTSAADNKPVTGADYTTYWEQTGEDGIEWVTATAYTSRGDFTLSTDIISVDKIFERIDSDNDQPIALTGILNYLTESSKFQTGRPLIAAIEDSLTGKVVRLWPIPDDDTSVLHLRTTRKLKDFISDESNPDFPVRWYEFLIYRLAERLCPEYENTSMTAMKTFKALADEMFMIAKGGEREKTDDDFVEPI